MRVSLYDSPVLPSESPTPELSRFFARARGGEPCATRIGINLKLVSYVVSWPTQRLGRLSWEATTEAVADRLG